MSRITSALLNIPRLIRFASVGIVGAAIDLTISSISVLVLSFPPELAKFIGAECAIIVMFVINDRWTFTEYRTDGWRQVARRILKSNLVRSGGILTQILVVFLLTRTGMTVFVAGVDIWPILTMPVAIACGFILNYVGETLLTWRVAARIR